MGQDNENMEKKTQVLAALASGLMATAVGSSIALTSSLIPQLIEEGFVPDFETASSLASFYLFAAIPSCLLGGVINDYIGRRRACLLMCLPLLAGWVMLALAPSLLWLLAGRVLTAVAAWVCYPGANVLLSEAVHPSVRGYLGVFPSILLATGMFQSYLLGYLLHWRTVCWVLSSQPFLLGTAIFFIKESPYWLIQQGRKEEAKESLQWYRGQKYDITKEFEEIVQKKEEDNKKTSGFRQKMDILLSKSFLKCLSITAVPFFLCQFTGITTLIVYMSNVFKDSGATIDPLLAPVIVGAVRVLTACCSSVLLRKGNRNYIFSSCSVGLCVFGFLLGSFSHWRDDILSLHSSLGHLPLLFCILMLVSHALGINSVLHLLTAEVFPAKVRSLGSSVTLCLCMFGNALNSNLYPILERQITFAGVFWIYSGCSLAMGLYAYLVIPDNRGLSLVTIERGIEGTETKKLMKMEEANKTEFADLSNEEKTVIINR